MVFGISDFQIFDSWEFFFVAKSFWEIWWWDIEEKRIKVFWRASGQNGRFWGPFLVHWSSNLPSNVEKWTFWCLVRPDRVKTQLDQTTFFGGQRAGGLYEQPVTVYARLACPMACSIFSCNLSHTRKTCCAYCYILSICWLRMWRCIRFHDSVSWWCRQSS